MLIVDLFADIGLSWPRLVIGLRGFPGNSCMRSACRAGLGYAAFDLADGCSFARFETYLGRRWVVLGDFVDTATAIGDFDFGLLDHNSAFHLCSIAVTGLRLILNSSYS